MGIFGVFAKLNKMNKEIEQNKDKYKDDLFTVVITSSLDDRKKSRAASIVKTWLGGSSSDIKELMNGSVPIEVRKHLSYEKAYKAIFNLKDEDIDAELVNETANGSSAAVVAEPYDVSEAPKEDTPAADDAAQLAQVELEKAQAEKAAAEQAQAELAAVKAKLEKEQTEKIAAEQAQAELAAAKAELEKVQAEKAAVEQARAELAAAKAELKKVQAEKAAAEQTQAELATVKAELEQAQAELAAAKAELKKVQAEKAAAEQARAELAAAKAELEKVQAEKAAARQAQAELAAAKAELEKVQTGKAAAQQAQAESAAAKAELKAKTETLSPQEQIASLGDSPNDYDFHKNYATSYAISYAISKDGEKLVVFGNVKDRQFQNGTFEKVVILDGVRSIGECAFYKCQELTEVIIADSVTEVKDRAFHFCESLEKVTMSANLKTIGRFFPFGTLESVDLSRCSKLKNVNLDALCYAKNILLPNVVEKIIGTNRHIKKINLPPSFKKIDEGALSCDSIYCYSRNIESPFKLITCCENLYLPQDTIKSFIDLLEIEDDVIATTEKSNGWNVEYNNGYSIMSVRPIPEEKLYVYDD